MIQIILMPLLGLMSLIVLAKITMKSFGIKRYCISFGLGHLFLIFILLLYNYVTPTDSQQQLLWIIPGIIDLPVSLLLRFVAIDNMVMSVLFLAFLGSAQYFVIGYIIDCILVGKISLSRKTIFLVLFCIILIILLIINFYNRKPSQTNYERSERALKKASTGYERFELLGLAARSSFKVKDYINARKYAQELLALSSDYKGDENLYGSAVHNSHIILGRLDLLEGKPERAIYHLLESAKIPSSPVMGSSGPDM